MKYAVPGIARNWLLSVTRAAVTSDEQIPYIGRDEQPARAPV